MAKCSLQSMKLLIDTEGERVLFAEVSKDCVDFLSGVLSMVVDIATDLLRKEGSGKGVNLNGSIDILNRSKDTLFRPSVSGAGGVALAYIVMDNLVVEPMSTLSIMTILNKFDIEEVDQLEEKVVSLGMDEAGSLLKAFMHSDQMVLTDVFLKGKGDADAAASNN